MILSGALKPNRVDPAHFDEREKICITSDCSSKHSVECHFVGQFERIMHIFVRFQVRGRFSSQRSNRTWGRWSVVKCKI